MLSENIKRIAEEKGITMYRVAKDGELSQSYVWELFHGIRQNPSIDIIKKISKILGVSVDELIK